VTAAAVDTGADAVHDVANEAALDGDATELPRSADGLTISRGFPAELDVPSRGGDRGEDDTSDDIAAEPAAESPDSSADATCDKAPPHFLVPASHWPNDPCDEHGGKGWEVSVVEKKGAWWKVRYVKARQIGRAAWRERV